MNKISTLRILVIALILLNLVLLSFYLFQKPAHPRHEGPRDLIIEKLNFDPEQVKVYDRLIEQHQTAIRTTESEIRKIKNQLYSGLIKTRADSEQDSLLKTLGELQVKIESIHYAHFEDIKKICRPEQQAAFVRLSEELAALFSRQGLKGKRDDR